MKRILALGGVLALSATTMAANGFDLVVYGTGVAGSWTTELTLANPNSEETSFGITSRFFQTCPPISSCGSFVTLPAHGSKVVDYPLPEIDNDVGAAYVYAGTGESPSLLARAHVPDSCATVDLPVFHLANLRALDPASLVLAGAVSGAHGRTNVVIANVPDPGGLESESLTVGIEVLSEDGSVVGASEVIVPQGQTLFLQDVVTLVGAQDVALGQVRLTKLAGNAVLWAVMTVTRPDGSVSVSVPQAP